MFLKHIFLRPEILSRLIFESSEGGKHYVRATSLQKARRALPEEIIRQLFVLSLIHDYRYPEELINLEWPIQVGREKKRADIVVLNEDGEPSIIIEVKVDRDQDSLGQLKSYMALTGAKYGAIVSATEMICIRMDNSRSVHSVKDIPTFLGNPPANQVSIAAVEYAGRDLAIPKVDEYHGLRTTVNTPSLDIRGLPWDARIHSTFRTKNSDGTWRKMRGVDREIQRKVEAELRAATMRPVDFPTVAELNQPIAAMPEPVTPNPASESIASSIENNATLSEHHPELAATLPSAGSTGNFHAVPETESNFDSKTNAVSQQAISAQSLTQTANNQPLIAIEKFEWDGPKHVRLTIEGHTLRMPYAEMDSYKKVRKQFFAVGGALDPRVKDFQWNELLRQQLKANPWSVSSCLPNLTPGSVGHAVIEAINQCRPGFCGGWVSSIALDELLKEKQMEKDCNRSKRQELMERLGYEHHPMLYRGRASTPLITGQRPVLYIKTGHVDGSIKSAAEVTRAYEAEQIRSGVELNPSSPAESPEMD